MDRKEDMKELDLALKTAIFAARLAGGIQRDYTGKNFDVSSKKTRTDLVTEVDIKCEEAIIAAIKEVFPDHGALAEEKGEYAAASGNRRWIIDPLDGTVNFAHGFPMYCSSVAMEADGAVVVGAVYDPVRDEMFHASLGGGAWLNDKPIHVSTTPQLADSLLATGFPYTIRTEVLNNLTQFSAFAMRAQAIRRPGAAALDLCYVASGRLDGFWEFHLKPWDMAAGALIVAEAGGMVSSDLGGSFSVYKPAVVASNRLIHQQMIDTLEEAGRE
ncbi:MAG: inositol monophosphatase [Nitrospinota bacterium]|nr:inositol monophosphatase [Nitrospinota bacterium]